MEPSIWNDTASDIPKNILLTNYEQDCRRASKENLNKLIPKKEDHVLRIATYNIHLWYDSWFSSYSPNKTNKTIFDIDADIIAIQEILLPIPSGTGHIISQIPKKYRKIESTYGWSVNDVFRPFEKQGFTNRSQCMGSTSHSVKLNTYFGNIVLSKLSINDSVGLILESGQEGRCAVCALVKIGKVDLLIVATHLDVHDGSGETRLKQIRQILHFVDNQPPEVAVLLLGDLNALRCDDYDKYQREWLMNNNQGYELDFATIDEIEKYGFRDLHPEVKYSVWSARRTDYIFGKNIPFKISGAYVFYSNASDHFPLIVDLVI